LVELKDSVELVYVDFTPRIPQPYFAVPLTQFQHVISPKSYPGHHLRWKYIPENLEKDRWWIFTDTQDVIFQHEIPDLDEFDADVLIQYEGMTHEQNGVWNLCIKDRWPQYSSLLEKPVYCCGVWAARGNVMYDYATKYIPTYDPNVWDQIPFNMWLYENGLTHKDCPELSAAMYSNYYTGKLAVSGNLKFTREYSWTDSEIVPAIIHGNGCSKDLLWA